MPSSIYLGVIYGGVRCHFEHPQASGVTSTARQVVGQATLGELPNGPQGSERQPPPPLPLTFLHGCFSSAATIFLTAACALPLLPCTLCAPIVLRARHRKSLIGHRALRLAAGWLLAQLQAAGGEEEASLLRRPGAVILSSSPVRAARASCVDSGKSLLCSFRLLGCSAHPAFPRPPPPPPLPPVMLRHVARPLALSRLSTGTRSQLRGLHRSRAST